MKNVSKRNLCMKVSYVGTHYSGFQAQPRDRTIQEELEKALHEITGEKIGIISSGRTDAGVHALGQIFNFITESSMELKRWCLALNSLLPADIVILNAIEVPLNFHARKAAKTKTYEYVIHNYRYTDLFHKNFRYHHPTELNIEQMSDALPCLLGEHDFTSFCSIRSTKESHVRTIYEARLEIEKLPYRKDQGNVLRFIFTGNGFLHHMIRIIAGTLISIGEGKINSHDMKLILSSKDRSQAGPTAAAHGLTLCEVRYEPIDF